MNAPQPYTSQSEHLWAELARVEQLVRARFEVWSLLQAGAGKAREHWGLVHVSESEVAAYLAEGLTSPKERAAAASAIVDRYRAAHDAAEEANAVRLAITAGNEEFRLPVLARTFGLDQQDVALLLLATLPEVDARYRLVYGYLQNDVSRELPTVELLTELLEPVAPDPSDVPSRLAAGAPLRTDRLLRVEEIAEAGDAPGRRRVAADERIVRYLLGDDTPGDGPLRLIAEAPVTDWDTYIAPPERLARLKELGAWCAERASRNGAVLLLHGQPGSGRRTAAEALANAAGRRLLTVDISAALQDATPWRTVVELIYREARLHGAALLWEGAADLFEGGEPSPEWAGLLTQAGNAGLLTFIAATESWEPPDDPGTVPFLRVALPVPDFETRVRLWSQHLGDVLSDGETARTSLARSLAGAFQLTPGQIVAAVATARSTAAVRAPTDGVVTAEDLADGCRRQSGRRLTQLAQRVEPRRGLAFDDLVLARPNRRQLEELRQRLALRAELAEFGQQLPRTQGLLVMFTGSSGTGKTIAAELLAQEQSVDLYKVDLAEVVSKYIGDTEKNLRRVFQEAEDANAIIFFDEADALFGKRGEVREARDRWANIEVNFLLQRVEEFAGVVILATNLRQNIDEAFMRRIHVVVEFPFPDAESRYRIWKKMFPAQMGRPSDDEIHDLAERFRIPGGGIRNVVDDAAFRALTVDRTTPTITMGHLAAALAREFQKLGRPLTVVEFGAELYKWVEEDVLMVSPTGV